jgi:hypothetical protein
LLRAAHTLAPCISWSSRDPRTQEGHWHIEYPPLPVVCTSRCTSAILWLSSEWNVMTESDISASAHTAQLDSAPKLGEQPAILPLWAILNNIFPGALTVAAFPKVWDYFYIYGCCWTDFYLPRPGLSPWAVDDSCCVHSSGLKGLLDSRFASQGRFLLGFQVPFPSTATNTPSRGDSRSGKLCSIAPSLGGQSCI